MKVRLLLLLLSLVVASGCMQPPDMTTVDVERKTSIRRTDMFQAVASNGDVVVAATATGVIVASSDGGKSWNRTRLPETASLVSIAVCSNRSFAALDFYKKVWIADAQAKSWQPHPLGTKDNVTAITCDVAGNLWAVGSRTSVHSSKDGGTTWTSRRLGEDAILNSIQFVDAAHGHMLGEFGLHYVTDDGGATWKPLPKIGENFYPYAAIFRSEHEGWASGVGGAIYHTLDGGASWATQSNPSALPIYSFAENAGDVFGVGQGGQIVATRNGSSNWERVDLKVPVPPYLTSIAAYGAGALAVAGPMGSLSVVPGSTGLSAVARN